LKKLIITIITHIVQQSYSFSLRKRHHNNSGRQQFTRNEVKKKLRERKKI
jgi:hypothetical protein